jgi:adhesin transport system outer membrane protein
LTLGGCATPGPGSYVVLLPDADGKVGTVTVTGAKGTVVVSTAAQAARLDGSPPFAVEASRIQNDFGSVLAARPPLPQRFLLYFEAGGTRLTAESQALLPGLLTAAHARPALEISVIGHTDTEGAAPDNERLGLQRAQGIARQLQEAGLPAEVIAVESHGESDLLVPTPDNTAEPRNRRVEVMLR